MKKTKGNFKVYFWSAHQRRWEDSGHTGLYAQHFVSRELAETAILRYGAGEVYYKASTKRPKDSPDTNVPIIVR